MYAGFAILGLIMGGFVAAGGGHFLLGAVGGAALGIVLARLTQLDRRVRQLESSQGDRFSAPLRPSAATAFKSDTITSSAHSDRLSPVAEPPERPPEPATSWHQPEDAQIPLSEPSDESRWNQAEREQVPPRPSILQSFLEFSAGWLGSGNIPVKVGVIISFFGVAFLLKYAIDRELLVIPLEFRLLLVAAAGLAMIMIGWRLREKVRAYALSLQGGGVGILFLTIFAALRLWDLIPATLAFFLLVALTFFSGALAVIQNSRSLAILGITGGFLAPMLTSTGQGSHVALFSYYLVLNLAILGISWFRAWRELNLIGFIFTFLIGSIWGYRYYKPVFFASTEPFLVLHFLLYQAVAILYALRQPSERPGMVDGTLVFGTPVIVFALQAALIQNMEYGLAISAAIVALFYAITAAWLFRIKDASLRLMTESFLALAVAFATIALPLALDARWTSAAWAVEGGALVWLGARQSRLLAKLSGTGLIFFSGVSFMLFGWQNDAGLPILNGNVLGGVLISLSAFFASRILATATEPRFRKMHQLAVLVLFVWAALWWLGTGWAETAGRVVRNDQAPVYLLFLALSAGFGAWLGQKIQWSMARWASMAFLPMLVWLALNYQEAHGHFLLGLGWLAWPISWVIQAYVLGLLDKNAEPMAKVWHFASLMFLTVLLALEAAWWTGLIASVAWTIAAASAIPGVMALLVWRFSKRPAWPVPVHPVTYQVASAVLVAGQVIYLTLSSVIQPGTPDPWRYIPVLNPFDLAMLFAMLTTLLSLATLRREWALAASEKASLNLFMYKIMLAAAFFILTTMALVRGVHHYTSVPWVVEQLFRSDTVQTGLSIYWGLLGFAAMIWGARSARRMLWLAGVGFMVLVVAKLFLVDLGNSGTIERIISFIGIGALLLLVGYFAPAPPRRAQESLAVEDNAGDRGASG